ncbi:MAG TPA: A/G-specific adenine glycosylase [Ktedonobacterales bacterium]
MLDKHQRAEYVAADPANADRRDDAWRALLAWYAAQGRAHLPWRHTRDPYAVLVSEVMLQQTQVDRVLPKYHEFLSRFPTLESLAAAPTADVIKAWASLGYNMRAVRLQQIARQAVAEYGGALPDTLDTLMALKGIGRYTAGAIACFAFEQHVATVDTNIRRVLWRVFRGIEPASWPSGERTQREALALAEWALPPDRSYDWQQALMDLGATVCVSRRPLCESCPLTSSCAAYAETATVTLFPSGEALARIREERASDDASQHELPSVAEQRATYTTSTATGAAAANTSSPRPTPHAPKMRKSIPFTSTTRYFRGRVVDTLRALESGASLSLPELGPSVKLDFSPNDDLPWLRAIVRGLARDGLVRVTGDQDDERVALP